MIAAVVLWLAIGLFIREIYGAWVELGDFPSRWVDDGDEDDDE